jgi:glycosyltransferase involved in cell wall biosynthesis
VASQATAIPETVGDAAILVDATSVAALAEAIGRVLNDPALMRRLSLEGRAHAAQFSWERTAALTRRVYEDAIK